MCPKKLPPVFHPRVVVGGVLPGVFRKLHSQLLFTALEEGGVSALPGVFGDEVLAGEGQFTVKTKHGHGA